MSSGHPGAFSVIRHETTVCFELIHWIGTVIENQMNIANVK